MMRKITRANAKKLLSLLKFATIDTGDYLEYTSLDFVEEYHTVFDEKHVLFHLEDDLNGVLNTFLEKELLKFGIQLEVVGALEDLLFKCPCCNSYSLDSTVHDICFVCKWHDDGTQRLDRVSGANKMTLQEGRDNLKKHGVSDLKYLDYEDREIIPLFSKYPVDKEY